MGFVLASLIACTIAALSLSGCMDSAGRADVTVPSSSSALRYVGRFEQTDTGAKFDRNGCEVQFQIQGASQLTLQLSQRLTASYSSTYSSPVGSQNQHFLVYVDGEPLSIPIAGSECKYCTFDLTGIANEILTEYIVVSGLSLDPHEIRIMKTSEPECGDSEPSPNWVTFHGVVLDAGNVTAPSLPRRQRRIEFIGDSITAGYCNLCDMQHMLKLSGGVSQQSFGKSWPTVICEKFGAECSTVAWSGLGLVENCCGGETYMPEIWERTVATDSESSWDFSSWVPDALVVNLGDNDGATGATPEFVEGYKQLVHRARAVYGSKLHIFLACGPMSSAYCGSVQQTIANATASGIQAHFLDQQGFLSGTFGPSCFGGHPGAQVDAAMGASGADFIASTLGWDTDVTFV